MKRAKHKRWTPEDDRRLAALYPNHSTAAIAEMMNLTIPQVYNRAYVLGVKKDASLIAELARKNSLKPNHGGRKYQFKKGHIPQNKGKKQAEFMSPEMIARTAGTRFKKGDLPKNTLYDGAVVERRDSKGNVYKWIRVELAKWVPYQRYLWEQAYGPIPKGCNIQFKDKNPLNCVLENLYLVSRKKQMLENSGSIHLPDGMVALYLAGGRGKNKELIAALRQNKRLLELKRQQLQLNRIIKKQCQS